MKQSSSISFKFHQILILKVSPVCWTTTETETWAKISEMDHDPTAFFSPRVIHMGANAWLRIKTGISALVLPRKVHLRLADKLPQKWGVPPGSPTRGQFGLWFCSLH